MKILDIMTAPWAILPAKLGEIREIYLRHTRGEKLTLSEIEAQIGPPADQPAVGYDVVNGVAVLPIQGVIGKRMNLMHAISGGVSTELIGRDFRMALSDPAIRSILLSIDSPGGSVDGTAELAGLIYGAR
jgi:ClpP class serine protease